MSALWPQDLIHPKVLDADTLTNALAPLKAEDKHVVFTNGCYDILHPGHVDLLARARLLGDTLVLGLNTDASIGRLGKGRGRPVNPLPVRAYVAAHLAPVDFVTWFDEDTPLELIKLLRPRVLVKGGDWPVEHIVGREVVEGDGGLVMSLPLLPGYSTTSLLEHIRGTDNATLA